MLRRTSIRTKLIVALGLLSTIVLLLGVSGFWGLYRNHTISRQLALRSRQQPNAGRLLEIAKKLHLSNDRLIDALRREGLIGSTLDIMRSQSAFELATFNFELQSLDQHLAIYPRNSSINDQPSAVTSANLPEDPTFENIRLAHSQLNESIIANSDNLRRGREQLTEPLRNLTANARNHSEFVSMAVQELSDDLSSHHKTWTSVAWICTAIALGIVAVLLWSLNSAFVKPFRTLVDGSRLVAGGQFDHRIDLGTGDELSELADAMNEMTDRFQGALGQIKSWCTDLDRQVQERTREVIQNEQLASVGFLAAGVAHEINNPLASIAWSAESLESRVEELSQRPEGQRNIDAELSKSLRDNLRRIEEEAYRCKGITERLLDFSRLKVVQRAPTNLVDLVGDVVALVSKVGKYRCKSLQVHADDEVIAHVNPQEIRQVVLNLVTNAMESVDTDGVVNIYVSSDGVFASIAIQDNGCGMSEEVLQHIFEPFFTRRRDGTGTGLGLSITYRIVSQHGGSLAAFSEGEGRGSRMEIMLPVAPDRVDDTQLRANLMTVHS